MPPDAVTTTQATSLIDQLPPQIAPYFIVAALVWWLTRATYKDTSQGQTALLDRYEARLDKLERTLANVTQDLEDSREAEMRCRERMDALEAKYKKQLAGLKQDIEQLRREQSEPMPA